MLPLPIDRFTHWPVQTQYGEECSVRGGQPVGFLFFAWRVVLDVNRQSAVRVALQVLTVRLGHEVHVVLVAVRERTKEIA